MVYVNKRYILDYEILGKRIKQARKLMGITQNELAELIHITTNQIAKIETNKAGCSIETLINIANALNVDMNFLLSVEKRTETENSDYMDILITNQLKEFNVKEKEALLLVINAMKSCKNDDI